MPRVLLICPDAFLRERLTQRLRDGEDLVLVHVPPADAVVVGEPVLTEAQKECLQMYVEYGSVEQVAMRRRCSVQTVKNHLLSAQRRLGAKNSAQLVHRAWCSGVLTVWSSTQVPKNWYKSSIDRNEGEGRIGVENFKKGG
ncbi:MAG: response regulator transcription factor [Armatimonadota bacterium]